MGEGRWKGGKSEGKEGRKQGERQEEPMRREGRCRCRKKKLATLGKPSKERCPLAWMGLPSWLCLLPSLGSSRSWPPDLAPVKGCAEVGSRYCAPLSSSSSLSLALPPSSHLPDPSWLLRTQPSPSSPHCLSKSSPSALWGPGSLWPSWGLVSLLHTRGWLPLEASQCQHSIESHPRHPPSSSSIVSPLPSQFLKIP